MNQLIRYFLIIIFSPAVIMIAYDLIFYFIPLGTNKYKNITYEFIFLIIIFDLFSLSMLFYFFPSNNKIIKKPIDRKVFNKVLSKKWYLIFVSLYFILINFLILQVFNKINYYSTFKNLDTFYSKSKIGYAWIYFILMIISFIILYDLYKNKITAYKTILFILSLILLGLTGGKSIVIIFLIFFMFILFILNNKKISFLKISIITFLILALFIYSTLGRQKNIDSYTSSEAIKLDFNQAWILNDTINYIKQNGASFFIALDDFYYFFIPRKIWPEKPISSAETRLLYPQKAKYSTNYTLGLYANLLLNLGPFGLILVPLVIIFFNYAYFKYILNSNKSGINFIIIFLCLWFIQIIRGGLINIRFFMFLPIIISSLGIYYLLTSFNLVKFIILKR